MEKVPSPCLRLYGSDGDQLIFAEWGGLRGHIHGRRSTSRFRVWNPNVLG